MRLALTLALLIGTSSTSAMAQDVVMRRPLPGTSVDAPQSCTVTGTCGTPAPTPTPAQNCDSLGNCTPAPTPPDGFTYNPGPSDPTDQVDGESYDWIIGDWQGDATCGSQGVMTRDVQCMATAIVGYDDSDDPQPIYSQVPAPYQQCADWYAQSPPATRYEGTGANCGYHSDTSGYTDWTLPPGASGTATCSAEAYRHTITQCKDAAGNVVADSLCEQGVGANGGYGGLETYQYGNFSNCTAKWTEVDGSPQCNNSVQQKYVQYSCKRPDGTVLSGTDESACPASDRPLDGWQTIGTCVKKADYRRITQGNCAGSATQQLHGTQDYQGLYWIINTKADFEMARQQCIDSGATCCAFNSDNGLPRVFAFSGSYDANANPYFAYQIDGTKPYPSADPGEIAGDAYGVLEPKWEPEGYQENVPYPYNQ